MNVLDFSFERMRRVIALEHSFANRYYSTADEVPNLCLLALLTVQLTSAAKL